MPGLSIRIDLTNGSRLGPGKIMLLQNIEETGSISAAGRAMNMSYRRAWLLVEELNTMFKCPLVTSQSGGPRGGGAFVTPFGHTILAAFSSVEHRANTSAKAHIGKIMVSASTLAPMTKGAVKGLKEPGREKK
jgi:molybdate transport system regulatory protein